MELSAWREAVSYGAYLQPIHLQVLGPKSPHASASAGQESTSKSTQSALQTSSKSVDASSNGMVADPTPAEASSAAKTAPDAVNSTQNESEMLILPPFSSESLNQGEQMALNVGGPVWAMDWLPSKPAANAAAVAAALTKNKQKKPRRASAAVKNGSKKVAKGKENNKVETPQDNGGETTTAPNGSAEAAEGDKLEWRFLALATHPPCQVEEGKVVKNTPPDHYYDVPETGRNLIQIWAVPVQRANMAGTGQHRRGKASKRSLVKPRMVYGIDHECGVAWDLHWCPLMKKFPKSDRRRNILGILAACFGDGTMRVLEIPVIPEERLQVVATKDVVVEKNVAVVVAKLPDILQLSVQWSPHNWNMLLSGGSDGSVSMWNIKAAISESDSLGNDRAGPEAIEPQRRFQDADTIGKQKAFDWGCGWVAIRAVAWSPFDEHLFASTGNDSVFKVWDVREPRVCLRSHRIRSTWGLALQWMDQTSVQISGDQGSVYMYDILSGSYQKLHFHPQIDSPVWDLQFGRRGPVPLLVSSCTSGSIRAAPAKKLYRAPQNCVEICRLSGEKEASVDKPFKSLTLSLEKSCVLGSADAGSLNTREFRERDAALHRLRLSSSTPGDYPCFMAAGGHAGLVILLEIKEVLDTLISTYFLPPSKKTGRPRKTIAPVGDQLASQAGSPMATEGVPMPTPIPVAGCSAGRKSRTLGSVAEAVEKRTVVGKNKKKSPGKGKAKARSLSKANPRKAFIQDDGDIEVEDGVEDEDEPEFEEEDEEEDESDLSLMMGESSDDDRVSVSDNDVEEEERATSNANPEEARLMKEYQLDLSEEDAYLLALQMSKFDDAAPAPAQATNADVPSSTEANSVSVATAASETQENEEAAKKKSIKADPKTKAKRKRPVAAKTTVKAKATAKAKTRGKKRARPSSATTEASAESNAPEVAQVAEGINTSTDKQFDGGDDTECKAPTPSPSLPAEKEKAATPSAAATPFAPKKATKIQPKKTPARKTNTKSKKDSPMLLEAISQAMAFQAFEYQLGMSEEDALKEALRLSEMEDSKRRPSRTKQSISNLLSEPVTAAPPTPTQTKQKTPATPRTKGAMQKKQELKKLVPKNDTTTGEEDPQRQRPQTPRRLEFSPLNGSEGGDQTEVPVASINGDTPLNQSAAPSTSTSLKKQSPKSSAKTLVKKPSKRSPVAASAKKSLSKKSPVNKPVKQALPKKSAVSEAAKKPLSKKSLVLEAEPKKPSPKTSLAVEGAKPKSAEKKQPAKSPSSSLKTPKETPSKVNVAASASAADALPATPEGKRPAKRSRSTGARAAAGSKAAKKRKTTTTTPRGRKRGSSAASQGDVMSEEDALLLALKMSEIEY